MPKWDSTKNEYVCATRINAHLGQAVITQMLTDLLNQQKGYNDVEVALFDEVRLSSLKQTAKKIKTDNFLSQGGFSGQQPLTVNSLAVCHKIPYKRFEDMLLAAMNLDLANLNKTQQDNVFGLIAQLMADLMGHGWLSNARATVSLLRNFIKQGKTAKACDTAHDIITDFDKSNNNLYFGFQRTNASISDRGDLHFNVLGASTGPVTATPRGANLLDGLNALEKLLGIAQTDIVNELEFDGTFHLTWTMTSGLDDKQTVLTDER